MALEQHFPRESQGELVRVARCSCSNSLGGHVGGHATSDATGIHGNGRIRFRCVSRRFAR